MLTTVSNCLFLSVSNKIFMSQTNYLTNPGKANLSLKQGQQE